MKKAAKKTTPTKKSAKKTALKKSAAKVSGKELHSKAVADIRKALGISCSNESKS